ncbi:MAG: ATP-binding protein [Comamonadaceae bacterium]|nr:ATP-binding protein [Comamonadaceae bacterium]
MAVKGDAVMLAVLLRNLVDNAVRYTQRGGEVGVAMRGAGAQARIVVTDNGPGIAPDERAKVGQRFYRVLGSEESGSGLGLSIVRRICDLHGAVMSLDPAAGRQRASSDGHSRRAWRRFPLRVCTRHDRSAGRSPIMRRFPLPAVEAARFSPAEDPPMKMIQALTALIVAASLPRHRRPLQAAAPKKPAATKKAPAKPAAAKPAPAPATAVAAGRDRTGASTGQRQGRAAQAAWWTASTPPPGRRSW